MTTYRARYGADSGGGYNNCGAHDPLIPGHYVAGGDVWGFRFTTNGGNSWWGCNWGRSNKFDNVRACFVSKLSASAGMAIYGYGTYNGNAAIGGGGLVGSDFTNPYRVLPVDTTNGFGGGFGSQGNAPSSLVKRPCGDLIDSVVVSGTEYIFTATPLGVFRYTNGGSGVANISGPTKLAATTDMPASNMFTTIRVIDQDNVVVVTYDRNATGGSTLPPLVNCGVYLLTPTTGHLTTVSGTSQVTVHTLSHPVNHIYDLKLGKDGNYYAACGNDGIYQFSLSGTTPTWTPLWTNSTGSPSGGNDNSCNSIDAASTGVIWAGQGGGDSNYLNTTNMAAGHGAIKSNVAQTSFSYAPAIGTINKHEFKIGDTASPTGRLWWLGGQNIALDGGAYDCSMIRVDPFDDNKICLYGRTGTWQSRDGGSTWAPAVNGFNGVESAAVRTYSTSPTRVVTGNTAANGSDDYDTAVSTDLLQTATKGATGSTVPAGNGKALAATGTTPFTGDDNQSYIFTAASSGAPAKITRNGVDITTDEFRGAVVNSNYIAVSQNGTIFISQFGGGSFVLEPSSGTVTPHTTITSFSPGTATVGGTVTTLGSAFTGATSAKVNTTTVATYSVLDDATLRLVVPGGATSGPITIVSPAGTAISPTALTVGTAAPPAAPRVSSFSPGTAAAGDTVTVLGTAFTTVSQARIGGAGGAICSYSVNSDTNLSLVVPSTASSGVVWLKSTGGTGQSTGTLNVTAVVNTGAPTITNLSQGTLSRTATMQIPGKPMWTTDAQAQQVASECVFVSGLLSMPRLGVMMAQNPNLIIGAYLKSIQNPATTGSYDAAGTKYPARWYARMKDGTQALQTGTFTNWVMESGQWPETLATANVQGPLSGNNITAASWAEHHIKDSVQAVAATNAQAQQAGSNPFRALWFDTMGVFSANAVSGFWTSTTNPGWNPHTAAAYTKPQFDSMGYHVGDVALGSAVNPGNLWVVGNGLRVTDGTDTSGNHLSAHVDMAMSEGWVASTPTGVTVWTAAQYEALLQIAIDCQLADGAVAQLYEWGDGNDTIAKTSQRRRFAAASYLIVHRGLATYEFTATKSTSNQWDETANDPNLYAMDLGHPTTSPTVASSHAVAVGTASGQASAAGLYARLYDGGAAIVNITATPINYKTTAAYVSVPTLELPGTVSYSSGGTVSIPATSGVLLAVSGAGTAPTNTVSPFVTGSTVEGQSLVTDPGTWTGSPNPAFTYQLQQSSSGTAGWTDISGASQSSWQIPVGTAAGVTTYYTDSFTGTVANSWGSTSTGGGVWFAELGTASDFNRTGGSGQITNSVVNRADIIDIPNARADVDASIDLNFPGTATGGNIQGSLVVRFQDTADYLDLNAIYFASDSTIRVSPRKVVAGTASALGSAVNLGTVPTTDSVHLRLTVQASTIKGYVASGTAALPATPNWTLTDSSITSAGHFGVRSFLNSGNTNSGPHTKWDNFSVTSVASGGVSYVGQYARARVVATNASGSGTATTAAVGPITTSVTGAPQWTTLPSITGTPAVGQTLTAHPGELTGTPVGPFGLATASGTPAGTYSPPIQIATVSIPWNVLQPAAGGTIATGTVLDTALSWAGSAPVGVQRSVRLRIYTNGSANLPTGALNADQAHLTLDTFDATGLGVAVWWVASATFRGYYNDLHSKLGSAYGSNPNLGLVFASMTMVEYAEPLMRFWNQGSNSAAYTAAGYTVAQDMAAVHDDFTILQAAWPNQMIGFAYNPFDGGGVSTNPTWAINDQVDVLGEKAMLQNNSMGNTASINNATYIAMYQAMVTKEVPIGFQLCAPANLATGETYYSACQRALGYGASLIELNGSPGLLTGTQLVSVDSALRHNATPTITLQWQTSTTGASWSNASGATGITWPVPSTASSDYARVKVEASNLAGTVDAFAPRVGPITGSDVAPSFTTDPSITGTPTAGLTLTANPGVATGSPNPRLSYQWQASPDNGASWQNLAGATTLVYTQQPSDVGALIRIVVTATNRVTSAQDASPSVGPVQLPAGDFSITVGIE